MSCVQLPYHYLEVLSCSTRNDTKWFCLFSYCSSCPAFSLRKLASGYPTLTQIPGTTRAVCGDTCTNSYCLDINFSLLRFVGLCVHKEKESKLRSVVRDCAGHLANTETGWMQPGESVTLEVWRQAQERATANRCMDLGCTLKPWERWLQLAHRGNRRPAAPEIACGFFTLLLAIRNVAI